MKHISLEELRLDVLPVETQKAFRSSITLEFLKHDWYLAGGTALALQVGHRESFDLDFFTERKDFDTEKLERLLVPYGGWKTTETARGTLYGIFHGGKMSFIAYPFFRPSPEHVQCGSIRVLMPDDIASMKVIALSQRGKKRDFVDLYWFAAVRGMSLAGIIKRAVSQYPEQEHSLPHFIKSLTYFADAEDDPMPKLYFNATWKDIKEYFQREVPAIAKTLLLAQ